MASPDHAAGQRLRRAPAPQQPVPMLATLTHDRFSDDDWIFERKLDGVRCLTVIEDGQVRLRSRTGRKLDGSYPEIAEAMIEYGPPNGIFDGEIVAFEKVGRAFIGCRGGCS